MNLWGARAVAPAEADPPGGDAVALRAEIGRLRRTQAGSAVVEQACGIVMALAPCTREPARHLLEDIARRCNTKLPDVAAALVATWEGEPLSRLMQHGLRHALRRLYAQDREGGSPSVPPTFPASPVPPVPPVVPVD
ncbi:ANTAR domain-containing protein [Streptomyces xylophagus]|uniref:ANTAR domain-containing protein n=1 Tax=Streptomyces xylophagus TaxID=285514 RepID=UPI0007C5B430|nr:ANTAR domain-containing protein [Streptomyces xylophagus]